VQLNVRSTLEIEEIGKRGPRWDEDVHLENFRIQRMCEISEIRFGAADAGGVHVQGEADPGRISMWPIPGVHLVRPHFHATRSLARGLVCDAPV
jgi:hypothetical protein